MIKRALEYLYLVKKCCDILQNVSNGKAKLHYCSVTKAVVLGYILNLNHIEIQRTAVVVLYSIK